MDPDKAALDDLIRQKRIDEIYSLKRSVEQLEEDIARGLASRRLGGDPRTAYLLMVQSFVRALEPILAPDETDYSPRWTDTPLGQYELPDGNVRRVVGLQQFLGLELSEEVTWTETERPFKSALKEEIKKSQTVKPPRRIAENAFRAANIALRERGIEIDTEDTTINAEQASKDGGIGV